MHLCGACVAYVLFCMMLLIITSFVLDVTPYLPKGEHSKMSGLVLRSDEGRFSISICVPLYKYLWIYVICVFVRETTKTTNANVDNLALLDILWKFLHLL